MYFRQIVSKYAKITVLFSYLLLVFSILPIQRKEHSSFSKLMGSKHQTTNLVFPKFFLKFFSVWAVEKENKLFIGSKQVFISVCQF